MREQIGTSRTPVREALHNLESEGLIQSIPRVGYVVRPVNKEEVHEICEIRVVIEGLAARWAAQRSGARLVAQLSCNIRRTEERAKKGDIRSFIELDGHVHEIIARLSGSNRLLELCGILRRHMLRYRTESIFLPETVFRALDGHKKIVEAIEKGDEHDIDEAVRFHLYQSRSDVLRFAFDERERKPEVDGNDRD